MKKHPFDKELRKKVYNATAPVSDDMWTRISGEINESKPRAFSWWMYTLAFLVVAIVFAVFFLPFDKSSQSVADTPEEIANTTQTEVLPDQNEDLNGQSPSSINNPDIKTADNEAAIAYGLDDGNQRIPKQNSNKSTNDRKENNKASISRPTNPDVASKVNMASRASSSVIIPEIESNESGSMAALTSEDGELHKPGASVSGLSKSNPIYQSAASVLLLADDARDFPEFDLPGNKLNYNPCGIKDNIECYSFEPASRNLYAEFMVGPTYHASAFRTKTDEAEALKDLREGTENYLFSFSVMGRASYIMGNGLALRAGLSYTELREKFEYFDPMAERRRLVQVIVDTIPIGPDLLRIVRDSVFVTERGQRTIEYPNRYRFVDIPLMAGFELENERFVLGINGGVMINLAMSKKARVLNASGTPIDINGTDNNDIYRTKAGLSLIASVNAGYKLNDDIQLFVEPHLRYVVDPITTESYSLDHNVVMASMFFGVRMGIN